MCIPSGAGAIEIVNIMTRMHVKVVFGDVGVGAISLKLNPLNFLHELLEHENAGIPSETPSI